LAARNATASIARVRAKLEAIGPEAEPKLSAASSFPRLRVVRLPPVRIYHFNDLKKIQRLPAAGLLIPARPRRAGRRMFAIFSA
jgi:hypothetical protein